MPATLNYPGVYIEEIPSGVRTITGVATSITAFVGRALQGPVDEPVLITSFGDFERVFGGLNPDYPMGYAVRSFYLNGGSQALIVRRFNGDDGRAKIVAGNLNLAAASPGEWGRQLDARVDVDGIDDTVAERFARYGLAKADLFNLTVRQNPPDGPTERFLNLSVKPNAGPRRIDRVLSQESRLVRLGLKDDGTPNLPDTPPAAMDTPAKANDEGTNSAPLAAKDDYLGNEDAKTGVYALKKADLFNLLCIPADTRDGTTPNDVYQDALKFCVDHRAMLIVDPPAAWNNSQILSNPQQKLSDLGLSGVDARNAALYYPRVLQSDPMLDGQIDTFVPCGIIAGVMARTDAQRGVWKAPAGLDAALNGIQGLETNLNDLENGALNPLGINSLRSFPVNGRVVWGARTMRGADQLADEYKYVPVRRLALFIEESLYRGLQWVVFEPNDEPLWGQIRLNVGAFMQGLFRQGAFQGKSAREAYFVKCDSESTTQNDINLGIVNIIVGFAPLKPAEFVVVKIQQMAGQIQV